MSFRFRWSFSRSLDEGRPLAASTAREDFHRRRMMRLHERLAREAQEARVPVSDAATENLVRNVLAHIQASGAESPGSPGTVPARRSRQSAWMSSALGFFQARPASWAIPLCAAALLIFVFVTMRPEESSRTMPPTSNPMASTEGSRVLPWWLPTGLMPVPIGEPISAFFGGAGEAEDSAGDVSEGLNEGLPAYRPLDGMLVAQARQLASDSQRAARDFLRRLPLPTVERFRPSQSSATRPPG